jgi:hypothetical protein
MEKICLKISILCCSSEEEIRYKSRFDVHGLLLSLTLHSSYLTPHTFAPLRRCGYSRYCKVFLGIETTGENLTAITWSDNFIRDSHD